MEGHEVSKLTVVHFVIPALVVREEQLKLFHRVFGKTMYLVNKQSTRSLTLWIVIDGQCETSLLTMSCQRKNTLLVPYT